VAQIEAYKSLAASTDDPKVQVECTVQAYSDSFVLANRTQDATALKEWWHTPAMLMFGDRGIRDLRDDDAVDRLYARMVGGLAGSGYSDSRLFDFEVTLITPSSAMAKCKGRRMRGDGSVLQTLTPAYLLGLVRPAPDAAAGGGADDDESQQSVWRIIGMGNE
jgi:hypothetical protein